MTWRASYIRQPLAYGKLLLTDIPVGPDGGTLKMIRSQVYFMSNCKSHHKFYADVSLLDGDGNQQQIETILGIMIPLPRAVYLEIETTPAKQTTSGLDQFKLFINGAVTPLLNITIGYTKFSRSDEDKKAGRTKKIVKPQFSVGIIIQKCTFGEFFGELRKLWPSSIPDDMDLAAIGAALGAEIERHYELHGGAFPIVPFIPFSNRSLFSLNSGLVSKSVRPIKTAPRDNPADRISDNPTGSRSLSK